MCFLHHSSFGFNVMCTFCIRNIDCNLLNQHNNCLQKLYKVYFFLDFLKVLRFSFPVPVVGPSAKTFIPCRAPNLQEEFSSRRFYPITNGFTPHETWLELLWTVYFFAGCILISFYRLYLLKYKAFLGVLYSSIWVLYQGRIFLAATEWENITYLYCFERAHYKVLLLLLLLLVMFSFLAYTNLATILTYLNSTDEGLGQKSGDWIHKYHKTALLLKWKLHRRKGLQILLGKNQSWSCSCTDMFSLYTWSLALLWLNESGSLSSVVFERRT